MTDASFFPRLRGEYPTKPGDGGAALAPSVSRFA